jgi:hypothetical protein
MSETEHLRQDQLFALVWAIKDAPPPEQGEGADAELARALRDLPDAFQAPLAPEHRLGPETVTRLMEHTRACKDCRMTLLEDGPSSRRPKTQADVAAEVREKEEVREGKVRRFWMVMPGGVAAFIASQIIFSIWRQRQYVKADESKTGTIQRADKPEREIDPLLFAGLGAVIVAAFLLADAYVIARELWIDYTRWKRAVPIIGKRWAAGEKSKKPGVD